MSRELLITLLLFSLCNVSTIVVAQADIHDIMVTSVTPNATEVEAGTLVNVTVGVGNKGTTSETFDITAYYDNNVIATKEVLNLTPDTNTSVTFEWNTTDVDPGTYELRAEAHPLPAETVTGDNALVSLDRIRVFVSPYIAVTPASTIDQDITPGMNYTISIYTDYDGDDVWGFEFTLTYNPNVLEGVDLVNGDLITDDVGTTMWSPGSFDNAAGELSLTGNGFFALPPATPPVTSGPGTLVHVTFSVTSSGDSHINLGDETRLIGFNTTTMKKRNIIDEAQPFAGHLLDGYFSNKQDIIHDVAVVTVTPSPTEVEVGELVNVTVVIENQGTVDEDVTVKVYRDYIPGVTFYLVGNETVQNLAPDTTKSLLFVWDTTETPFGDHTVTAVVSIPSEEADLEDNSLESSTTIQVKIPPEEPVPIVLILGIVAVAIIVIAIIVYISRRRRKQMPRLGA
ncbi:MAG: CARDB domain-containing protein [Promethearchaeota archaeon]